MATLPSNILPVLIYNGQSNGSGRTTTVTALETAWQGIQDNIWIWVKANYPNYDGTPKTNPSTFEKMRPLYNTATYDYDYTHWGTEQSLIHGLYDLYGQDMFIFKNTYGGLIIDHWIEGNGLVPDMWANFTAGIAGIEAYAASLGKTPKYIQVWMQGEENCTSEANANAWLAKYLTVQNQIRSLNSNLANIHTIIIKMWLGAPWNDAYQTIVNNSIDSAAATLGRHHIFNPNDYDSTWTTGAQDGHYKDADLLFIGQKYLDIVVQNNLFDALSQRVKLIWSNPTGAAATNIRVRKANSVDGQGALVDPTVVSAVVSSTATEYIDSTTAGAYYDITRLGNGVTTSDSVAVVDQVN